MYYELIPHYGDSQKGTNNPRKPSLGHYSLSVCGEYGLHARALNIKLLPVYALHTTYTGELARRIDVAVLNLIRICVSRLG